MDYDRMMLYREKDEENCDAMIDSLIENLGYEEAFKALWFALSTDEQIANYDWIARMYDFPSIIDEDKEDEY